MRIVSRSTRPGLRDAEDTEYNAFVNYIIRRALNYHGVLDESHLFRVFKAWAVFITDVKGSTYSIMIDMPQTDEYGDTASFNHIVCQYPVMEAVEIFKQQHPDLFEE